MSTILILLLLFLLLHIHATTSTPSAPLFPEEARPTKSGYLPVSTTSNSSLFYAFYEAQRPAAPLAATPLLLWLQGGPGCSSMVGNFFELGPWLVRGSGVVALEPNPASWNRLFGLLFIDSPVGVGFSVAAASEEIPRDQEGVARDLWLGLQAFLSSNPGFRRRPFYITGESYAGKYVPALAHYISRKNGFSGDRKQGTGAVINLKGAAIGNGLTHPVAQVKTHAANGYFTGLLNDKQRTHLEALQRVAVERAAAGNWSSAADARNEVLDWFQKATSLATLFDMRRTAPYETRMVTELLRQEEARAAMRVGAAAAEFDTCSGDVGRALHGDVMKSVKPQVEAVLRGGTCRVLLYQGQFDLRDGVVATEAWVRELEWEGLEGFAEAEREAWKVGEELAGYVQAWGSLTHVVVVGAGHLVPADQGVRSQAMIEDWVLQRGVFSGDVGMAAMADSRRFA